MIYVVVVAHTYLSESHLSSSYTVYLSTYEQDVSFTEILDHCNMKHLIFDNAYMFTDEQMAKSCFAQIRAEERQFPFKVPIYFEG